MTDEIPTPRARRPDLLSILWQVLAAPQTLLALLVCGALALVLAAAIPQVPLHARGDPGAWLAAGQVGSLVRALSLYDLSHSLGVRLLLAVSALALFARAVEAAELAARASGRRRWQAASFGSWAGHPPPLVLPASLPPAPALAEAAHLLAQAGYRCAPVPDHPAPTLVACRRVAGLWARPAMYVCWLAALAGAALLAAGGWQAEDWRPALGESQPIGLGPARALRLDAFDLERNAEGTLVTYRSQVTWLDEGTPEAQGNLSPGHPQTRQGITVRQVGLVPEVRASGRDGAGHPLLLQAEGEDVGIPAAVDLVFPSPQAQPLLFLPRQDLFLVLSFAPPCAGAGPTLYVDLLRDDGATRQRLGSLSESGSVRFDDLQVDFDLAFRPVLRTGRRPGTGLALAGAALALAALAVARLMPARLAWVVAVPGQATPTAVHLLFPPRAVGGRWGERLVDQLARGLAHGD